MGLLDVTNVKFGYLDEVLLNNVNFTLLPLDRIGIVGANGSGKSTFMNLIAHRLTPDSGDIIWDKNVTYSYLDQHLKIFDDLTIKEYLYDAYKDLFQKEEDMNKLYGCCQGDVVHCFYPDDEKECIPYLNDLYWNLGSEIIVHDTDEPVNNADDIDGYCDYIVHTDYKLTLKEEVAKHLDTTPDNVTLYEFKHYIHVPVYEIAK